MQTIETICDAIYDELFELHFIWMTEYICIWYQLNERWATVQKIERKHLSTLDTVTTHSLKFNKSAESTIFTLFGYLVLYCLIGKPTILL